MPRVFALALFVSAALLFWVQPMFARMVLPLLGGTSAVWNTCVVFFQAALLAGYAYSHLAPARLGVRRQAVLQVALVALPFAVLPVAVPEALAQRPDYVHPALWLLGLLLLGVGLPFFVVATTAPLLQRWFASTGHPAGRDPYFLYAASNLGSMIGLLSYPFLLEPLLPLDDQAGLWTAGYAALAVLVLACAVILWRAPALLPLAAEAPAPAKAAVPVAVGAADRKAPARSRPGRGRAPAAAPPGEPAPQGPSAGRRLLWVLLAFVPSSLMLSVTTYLTTDVAPVPLLWVVPLALYLLTFILAFARRPLVYLPAVDRALPLVVLMAVVVFLSEASEPLWLVLLVHLLTLFWLALFCHGSLARMRPDPRHLTEFYFWLSLGGVLGGLFNALVAPLVFRGVTEYPLVLVLGCLLRGPALGTAEEVPAAARLALGWGRRRVALDRSDLVWPLAALVLTVILVLVGRAAAVSAGPLSVAVMFALPLVLCYTFHARPLRFGLAVGGVLLASGLYPGVHGRVLYRGRNFFGVHRVVLVERDGQEYRRLIHGNTIHGEQAVGGHEPLTYYHRDGPAGRLFRFLESSGRGPGDVGVVGLGAGSLAAYARAGRHWTFYEIDPLVIWLARDSGYFTFLRDCRAERLDVVEGDARLLLAESAGRHDLLVIDAFNSDALPVHLYTREALREVYLPRLTDKGILAFHVSNNYLDMAPVLARLAQDAGLVCLRQADSDDKRQGKFASVWVVMARPAAPLDELERAGWERLRGGPGQPLWTDDHCNLLAVLK